MAIGKKKKKLKRRVWEMRLQMQKTLIALLRILAFYSKVSGNPLTGFGKGGGAGGGFLI